MGPRLMSRGKMFTDENACVLGFASMGPRLMSRGKRTDAVGDVTHHPFNGAAAHEPRKDVDGLPISFARGASMGPRLMSRGKYGNTAWRKAIAALQWGRGS